MTASGTPGKPISSAPAPGLGGATSTRRVAHLWRAVGALAVTVLALVMGSPVPASATAATAGGATRGEVVPLPVADLDSSFVATNEGVTAAAGTTGTWNNVTWFSYTPAQAVRVFIRATSISPAGWDNTLEVWTGGSLVAHNDDFYGLDASLTVNLQAGTTYQIGMGGYRSTSRGSATLTFATRVPTPPLDVQATFGDASADVSWSAPADVAGGVTSYTVLCTPEGGEETVCGSTSGTPPQQSRHVTGLTNGVSYTFRVTASNVIGASDPSAPVTSIVPKAVSTTVITTDPVTPVSGQPYDVRVTVGAGGAAATGTVDVTVGGVVHAGLALVDGVATVEDRTDPVGTVSLAASYGGTNVIDGSSASGSVSIAKRPQTVTFDALPTGLAYAGTPTVLHASASSELPVTFAASGACAVSDGSLHLTGVGPCEVTATQVGDSQTESAQATQTVDVARRGQAVTFGALPALVYGQSPVALVGSSSVGLPVTFSAEGSCTVTDGLLAVTGVGPCTVTATQAGDELTGPASSVVRTGAIAKRSQTVTIAPLAVPVFGGEASTVDARSEFGLPVTFSVAGACLVDDTGRLTAVGTGLCVVTASAAGDEVTLPAEATASITAIGPDSEVEATLDRQLGELAEGAPVSARGTGLLPGTVLTLEVHSTPQVIGTAIVGADGTAVVTGVLPAGLEGGAHRLIAVGTALDGAPAQFVLPFQLAEDGTILRIEERTLALAATGADGVGAVGVMAAAWVLLGAGLLVLRRRRVG
ncbi:fibronectin type III domain-containing protein [Cellulomonas soli]|uniref:fibronectin type III domain-containing protein n=1 Tax=Cellulomonas soli TaxID=931535 RepID=UPI003F84DEBD